MSTEHTAAIEVRIEHLADLMRSLRWVRGETYKRLAKEWGLTRQRVRELSAEASKRVRTEATERAGILAPQIEATCIDAMRAGRRAKGPKMKAVGVTAANLAADLCGIKAPKRVEANVSGLAELFLELEQRESSSSSEPASG